MKVPANHSQIFAARGECPSKTDVSNHSSGGEKLFAVHKKSGFTLIEVVMAITITGFSLIMLFATQTNLVQQSSRALSSWHAMVTLKNLFVDVAETKEPEEQLEKTVDNIALTYALKKVDERSSLKNIKQLRLARGQARWDLFGEQDVALLGAVVVPEKKAAKGKP